MRPVRVTTAGASPVLPLRMVAAGAGASIGITLWVIGEGRYETQNFPSFAINPDDLVWDFATNKSNYVDLRVKNESALGGRGWQVESSMPVLPQQFDSLVDTDGRQYGGPFVDAAVDYDPVSSDSGISKSSDQVRQDDLDTLFKGMDTSNVRVTRMRTDLARTALSTDLDLKASVDQSILQNQIYVTKSVNAPPCPTYPDPPPCPSTIDAGASSGGVFVPMNPGGGGSAGGAAKESFSCATSSSRGGTGAGEAVAAVAIAGLFAVSAIRGRRRRRG
jgi:hypothetical protein